MTNLLHYGGPVWMLTITGPGTDVLPWAYVDNDGQVHGEPAPGRERRVEPHAGHEWNRTAPARWRELHRWAQQATRREFGVGPTMLVRVWQMQSRGVLHAHLAVGVGTELEKVAAKFYVSKLRERAREFGFGFIDARDRGDGSTVMEPHRAAGYMSAYLSSSEQLDAAIALRERPKRLVWVSPALTSATGCTMRRLRRARFLWHIRRGSSSIVTHAGRLPMWFRDRRELELVQSLLRVEAAAPT